jgi:hypothetical protein
VEMDIIDFANEHKLKFDINFYAESEPPRFSIGFSRAEVSIGPMLIATHGSGYSVDEALLDYATKISDQKLVINAFSKERVKIDVPKLSHTKIGESVETAC